MKLHELRAELMVQAQHISVTSGKSERIGAYLAIHRLVSLELRHEGVVLPCQNENEPPEEP
jgi:hypothetical protein